MEIDPYFRAVSLHEAAHCGLMLAQGARSVEVQIFHDGSARTLADGARKDWTTAESVIITAGATMFQRLIDDTIEIDDYGDRMKLRELQKQLSPQVYATLLRMTERMLTLDCRSILEMAKQMGRPGKYFFGQRIH